MKKSFIVTLDFKNGVSADSAEIILSYILRGRAFDVSITPCPVPARDLEEVYADIEEKLLKSRYSFVDGKNGVFSYAVVRDMHKQTMRFGYARCHWTDKSDNKFGHYLALARACGFKDLEEELVALS